MGDWLGAAYMRPMTTTHRPTPYYETTTYRLELCGPDGLPFGAPTIISCESDVAALETAAKLLPQRAVNVWQYERFVAKVETLLLT